MNNVEFLRAIWPDTGLYVIALLPVTAPGDPKARPRFKHYAFETIAEASAFALKRSIDPSVQVYHLNHSLSALVEKEFEGRKWMGVQRSQDMMLAAKCYFCELDCGPPEPNKPPRYPDQSTAFAALKQFVKDTGLPRPLVLNSGRGLHVYWLLSASVPSKVWQSFAVKMKRLHEHKGLLTDPTVTADSARVLRPLATWHRKDPLNPIKVVLWCDPPPGEPVTPDQFHALLDAACAGLPPETFGRAMRPFTEADKPSFIEVAEICPSTQRAMAESGTGSGKVWMLLNGMAHHIRNGVARAHQLASLHPTYVALETQQSIDRQASFGPVRCGTFQEVYAPDSPCFSCSFFGLPNSSPVAIARRQPKNKLPGDVPQPKLPYSRTKRGIEYQPPAKGEAEEPPPPQVILHHDFYPTELIDEPGTETKAMRWVAILPKRGEIEFKIPLGLYADENQLVQTLANKGVVVDKRDVKQLGAYMSHYIKLLQAKKDERTQIESFGWVMPERRKFAIGEEMITPTGTEPALISRNLANAAQAMGTAGTLEAQVKAMDFYNFPEYQAHKFILGAFAGTPTMYVTRLFGLAVVLTGGSGSSKSTVLYAGCGFYGQGDKYAMSGGDNEATTLGRANRGRMLRNLPVAVDEITLMEPDELKRMVMSVTQNGERVGLTQQGNEKRGADPGKATLMIATSNASAHAQLSRNNLAQTAGSMRALQVETERVTRHTKTQADQFLRDIGDNHGWIGREVIKHSVRYQEQNEREFRDLMARVDRLGNIQPPERYWSAGTVAAVHGLMVTKRLGVLPYDPEETLDWFMTRQLPYMRRVVGESYATPLDILNAYVNSIASNMLVMDRTVTMGRAVWTQSNTRNLVGGLKARFEMSEGLLYLDPHAFRSYCDARKVSYDSTVQALTADGIMDKERMMLTRHATDLGYASAYIWNLRVHLRHEKMIGGAPIEVDGKVVALYPGAKNTVA